MNRQQQFPGTAQLGWAVCAGRGLRNKSFFYKLKFGFSWALGEHRHQKQVLFAPVCDISLQPPAPPSPHREDPWFSASIVSAVGSTSWILSFIWLIKVEFYRFHPPQTAGALWELYSCFPVNTAVQNSVLLVASWHNTIPPKMYAWKEGTEEKSSHSALVLFWHFQGYFAVQKHLNSTSVINFHWNNWIME